MTHFDVTSITSAVVGAVATSLLAAIGVMLRGLRKDFRRFMAEHLYLLRIADWTKVNLANIFDHLNLTPTEPPPLLPDKKG